MSDAAKRSMSRREFCQRVAVTPLAVAAAVGAAGCAMTPLYRGALSRGRIAVPRASIAPANAPDGALLVSAEEYADPVIVVWDIGADGTPSGYRAFSALCTHQRCAVRPGRTAFTCPCHGSVFDRAGRVVRGPAEEPLAQLPIEETRDGIEIIVAAR